MKKMIARILIVAFMVGFCPINTAAVQNADETALQTTIKTCYTEKVTDWYELAVVYAGEAKGHYEGAVDLSAYTLPETPKSGATAVFVALMKGDKDAAQAALPELTQPAGWAAAQAMNMLAMEAYKRSDPSFVYDKAAAIQTLLDFRNAEGGYGGASYIDVDSAGMALAALSLYDDSDYAGLSVERDKLLSWIQLKQDIAATACNANTTAAVLWGLQAAQVDTSTWQHNQVETLMSFYVDGGGFGFKDNKAINPFATKQAALALAEVVYGTSFFTNIKLNENQYTKTMTMQVLGQDGKLQTQSECLSNTDTLDGVCTKILKTPSTGYTYWKNGVCQPSNTLPENGDTILAIAPTIDKVVYCSQNDSKLGVTEAVIEFENHVTLTLQEFDTKSGTSTPLVSVPIDLNGDGYQDLSSDATSGSFDVAPLTAVTNVIPLLKNAVILPTRVTMKKGAVQKRTVLIRVEGKTGNLLSNEAFVASNKGSSRLTVYDAVTQALKAAKIPYKAMGNYISEIAGQAGNQTSRYDGWSYLYNNQSPMVGMGDTPIADGDQIIVYYGYGLGYGTSFPKIGMQKTGSSVQLTLTDEANKPLSDVTVLWDQHALSEKTDASGVVTVPAEKATPGQHTLQVEKVDADGIPQLVRLPDGYTVQLTDGSVTPDQKTVSVRVLGPNGSLYGSQQIWSNGMTALDALRGTGLALILDGDYVKSIGGYAEFDYGVNSGWKYRVNGTAPSVSAASYRLAKGDTLEWYYIRDYHTEDHTPTARPTVTVKDGVARVRLTRDILADAVKNGEMVIQPKIDEKADRIIFTVPIAAVVEQKAALTLKSDFGVIRFPIKALSDLSGELTVSMTRSQKPQKEPIGKRDQVTFSVMSDGKEVHTFRDAVTLTLPYTPASNEIPRNLFLCEVDTAIHARVGSEYRKENNGVVLESTHLSTYAVGYDANLKEATTFTDVQNASAIRYLEQRGIVKGTGAGLFSPTRPVTRGEFITMLARVAGADTGSAGETVFRDVPKDSYYAGAVNWAAREQIIKGTSAGIFSADVPLTAQDMSRILSRFAGLAETNVQDLVTRADSATILAEFLEHKGIS